MATPIMVDTMATPITEDLTGADTTTVTGMVTMTEGTRVFLPTTTEGWIPVHTTDMARPAAEAQVIRRVRYR